MQILYIWVEKYKCLENFGINLTSQYNINYDKYKNNLVIKESENIFKSILDLEKSDETNKVENTAKINDLVAIVGENGVGKTTITSLIREIYNRVKINKLQFDNEKEEKFFFIYEEDSKGNGDKENNKSKLYYGGSKMNFENNKYNIEYCGEKDSPFLPYDDSEEDNKEKTDTCKKHKTIYYSAVFDGTENDRIRNFIDISTNHKIYMSNVNRRTVGKNNAANIHDYKSTTIRDYINFLNSNIITKSNSVNTKDESNNKSQILNICNKLKFGINVKSVGSLGEIDNNGNLNLILVKIRWKFSEDNISIKERTISKVLSKYYVDILNKYSDEVIKKYNDYFGEIDVFHLENDEKTNIVLDFIKKIIYEYYKNIDERDKEKYDLELQLFEGIKILYDFLKNDDLYSPDGIIISDNRYKNIIDLQNKIDEYFLLKNYIDISLRNLSSGEIAYLNMYSRFNGVSLSNPSLMYVYNSETGDVFDEVKNEGGKPYNYIADQDESFTIIIDECDVYLHPKWQQSYIKDLISMCNVLFSGKTINIILTTHSPIVLSDIPKSNVILLENKICDGNKEHIHLVESDENENTFAANIHELYSKSFFLNEDKSLTIGTLAQDTISKINAKLKDLSDEINEIEKDIDDNHEKGKKISDYSETLSEYIDNSDKYDKIVSSIGEPLIKNIFENKISKLKEKINKLKGESAVEKLIEQYKNLDKKQKKEFEKNKI